MQSQIQSTENPFYPDMLWSKPENKLQAGKLLIIGGNTFGFASVAEAYDVAKKAGAGEVKVLLPDKIQKIVGAFFEDALFAASSPSGSFGKDSLNTMLEAGQWANGVMIVGDVSRNAETASVLELFINTYKGPLVIANDAAELLIKYAAQALLERPLTNIVATMADAQLFYKKLGMEDTVTFSQTHEGFIASLTKLSKKGVCILTVKRNEQLFVATGNKSLVHTTTNNDAWRVVTAVCSAVWLMQNPGKPLEAVITSLIESEQIK